MQTHCKFQLFHIDVYIKTDQFKHQHMYLKIESLSENMFSNQFIV